MDAMEYTQTAEPRNMELWMKEEVLVRAVRERLSTVDRKGRKKKAKTGQDTEGREDKRGRGEAGRKEVVTKTQPAGPLHL